MTLLELLVQELPKLGGWPEEANKLKFSTMKRVVDDVGKEHFHLPTLDRLALNERIKFVTREQYDEALAATKEQKMKYEYLKGSEKNFEGAPEWANQVIKSTSIYGYAFVDEFDYMCKYQARENPCDIGNIVNPSVWKVIAERRPITEPSWSGIGLPPVGCECEVLYDTVRDEWFLAKIIGHDNGSVVGRWLNGDGLYSLFDYSHASCSFRPIRSEADKKRDAACDAMSKEWRMVAGKNNSGELLDIYSSIYDAIAAGKIPGVKLED